MFDGLEYEDELFVGMVVRVPVGVDGGGHTVHRTVSRDRGNSLESLWLERARRDGRVGHASWEAVGRREREALDFGSGPESGKVVG